MSQLFGNKSNASMRLSMVRLIACAAVCVAPVSALAAPDAPAGAEFELVRLTPADAFCSYSGYATSPENADGSLISYTKFPDKPTDGKWGKDAEIWVCDRDGTNHSKVADVANDNVHNGAEVNWIDKTFATARNVKVGDAVGSAVLNMRTGEVVHGPYVGLNILHETVNGLAIGMVTREDGPMAEGIWTVDVRTGQTEHLLSKRDLLPWKDRMKRGSDDIDDWGISHPEWSPSGKYFAFVLFHNWKRGYQFFYTADGEFHAFFGEKLSHPNWYDDDHVFGGRGKRTVLAKLDGTVLRTVAGPSAHPALSPDKKWITTETHWKKPTVSIVRYPWGSTEGQLIDEHDHGKITWGVKAHTNASFGHDGRRIYYIKPNAAGFVECWYAVAPGAAESAHEGKAE